MINQVTLVGRLTKDPELKTTIDGTPVTQVTLAVNRNFRNHNGEIDADFVQCTLWRKAAENTCYYCRKGALIGITGRLQTRHYDNREGKRVYVTEVVTESVRFLSSRPHASASDPPAASERPAATASPARAPEQRTAAVPPYSQGEQRTTAAVPPADVAGSRAAVTVPSASAPDQLRTVASMPSASTTATEQISTEAYPAAAAELKREEKELAF